MEHARFGNNIIARIDKGEEIISSIEKIVNSENISLASINALGAVGEFTVGVFKTKEKKYYSNSFKGDFEIVSLHGTVSTMEDRPYFHLHMSAADENANVFGGHLNQAIVSATCEMVITVIDGKVSREYNDNIGLNLFKF